VADVTGDGRVDDRDLAVVIRRIFYPTDTPKNPNPDINRDLRITAADVVAVVSHLH
jgi:hypothetical protein